MRIPYLCNMKQVAVSLQGNILILSVHEGVPCLLEKQHPFISVRKTLLRVHYICLNQGYTNSYNRVITGDILGDARCNHFSCMFDGVASYGHIFHL